MFATNSLFSKQLNRMVNLNIHIPEGCDVEHPCPVLYMHDGDRIFEDNSARIPPESLHYKEYYQAYSKFLPEVIIIGIDPPLGRWERTAELSPYTKAFDPKGADFEPVVHGKGDLLLSWLVEDLKPWVDENYPTIPGQEYTAIGGSSSGALNAMYAEMRYPNVFGRLLMHGPAFNLWMDKLLETAQTASFLQLKYCYMDIGTEDSTRMSKQEDTMASALRMRDELLSRGMDQDHFRFFIIPNGRHTNYTWRWTFPDALRWVFQDLI